MDILDLAIEKLYANADEYGVTSNICGIVKSIDDYQIKERNYDLVMAVSSLEHVDSKETFVNKLREIEHGIRKNGIVCLVVNSNIKEFDKKTGNEIDMIHCNFLLQIQELLEHNDFLTAQSQKMREFYKYMAKEYPFMAFTFKGRIKSLIRAEEKFNGYVVEFIYDYYEEHGKYPSIAEVKKRLSCFRDLIAYRIIISVPRCHLNSEEDREEQERKYLYQIANVLPGFLEEQGFSAEPAMGIKESTSPLLNESVKPYYRDYICSHSSNNYQSLHITFYDNSSRCYMEVQLRTKMMDDIAEIGSANHIGYEKEQEHERARRDAIPEGECLYFDEAYERGMKLLNLKLAELDVNMFSAVNNSLINDGCGLYRGRLILPYEHLSRFQNDLID